MSTLGIVKPAKVFLSMVPLLQLRGPTRGRRRVASAPGGMVTP